MLCAVLAAGLYAVASVLQQRTASAESHEHALRIGLLGRLIQNPLWLLGVVADVLGFVFQFLALATGTLVVVQPLLVSGLLFALPIGARWGGFRMQAQDWVGAVTVCAGLGVFLVVARPAPGHDNVRLFTWAIILGTAVVMCGTLLLACRHRSLRQRAVLLSGVAGISYGVAAALTKACAHLLSRGVTVLLTHWQPYVLVGVGLGGMVIIQSAFQAGTLDASLPTMTVVDPVVSILIGAIAFGESVDIGLVTSSVEVLSLVVMTVGVFLLARTKAVRGLHERPAERRTA